MVQGYPDHSLFGAVFKFLDAGWRGTVVLQRRAVAPFLPGKTSPLKHLRRLIPKPPR